MKVLIVDDEAGIRDVIKEYCLFENFDVLEAEDGENALTLVKDNSDIDLIVLDIMMPKMDGYTTLKEIRKLSTTPVIMLSARSEEYNKLLSFELGVDDYVTKPFSPKELMARVKAVITRTQGNLENYKLDDLEVNFLAHSIKIDGKKPYKC